MLTIKDLVTNKEMTKQAMAAVFGGGHGIGTYLHFHSSPWVKTYSRAFFVIIKKGGKKYLGLQRQWTWKRLQVAHRGILTIGGRVVR